MKNFWLVLGAVVVLVLSICFSDIRLVNVFNFELNDNTFYGEVGEVVYASGDLGYVFEQKESAKCITYVSNEHVVGECIWLEGSIDKLNYICNKLGLTIFKKYYVEDRLMVEGNSALIKYRLNGTNQNVQICFNQGLITIGSPIIYGNY